MLSWIISKLKKFKRINVFHPQFLVFIKNKVPELICHIKEGVVLDIGCADKFIAKNIDENKNDYIGLDYFDTAINMYKTNPDVFGDAQNLPFADNSIDTVILLDVLEHIPDADSAMKEISRVLCKSGGILILQIHFMYPLHDAPYDYQRFTIYGIRQIAKKFGFNIEKELPSGNTIRSGLLLLNIGIAKSFLSLFKRKFFVLPAIMLLPFVALAFLILNLFGLISSFQDEDYFMPSGIGVVFKKNNIQ